MKIRHQHKCIYVYTYMYMYAEDGRLSSKRHQITSKSMDASALNETGSELTNFCLSFYLKKIKGCSSRNKQSWFVLSETDVLRSSWGHKSILVQSAGQNTCAAGTPQNDKNPNKKSTRNQGSTEKAWKLNQLSLDNRQITFDKAA